MISKFRCIIFFLFFIPFYQLKAQVNDAALWLHVSAEKNLSSFFSIEINQEFRLNENISELGTAFTEVGFQYKIFRNLRVGANYRFLQRRRLDDSYSLRHQHSYFFTFRQETGKVSFILREKFQSRYTDVYTSERGETPHNLLRSRLMVRYNLQKRYVPFIAGELYYQLNNPRGNELEKMRYQAGFRYEINKYNSLSLAYLKNKEINQVNPWTDYVIDIGYEFTF